MFPVKVELLEKRDVKIYRTATLDEDTNTVVTSGLCTVTNKVYIVKVPLDKYKKWMGGENIQNVLPIRIKLSMLVMH